tara:strand:- start:1129 stop:1875 length:747 start_codon:yes stop_codon:yes gene_type:complete
MAANWKMNKTVNEALAFAEAFIHLGKNAEVDIVIAPPFTALAALSRAFSGTEVKLAAQNTHSEASGAFTGEISPDMLKEFDCQYTIIGHSERRALFGETDAEVDKKAVALIERNIRPIVCVGESLQDRESGQALKIVAQQVQKSLESYPSSRAEELVLAYEPVWAIGTGKTASPDEAQEVHKAIRRTLKEQFGSPAEQIRIQYGGSVKPENAGALMAQKDIDGALIGGAGLAHESFAAIVRYQMESKG